MKIKESRIKEIIEEEFIDIVAEETEKRIKQSSTINESLDKNDYKEIRDLIRAEVAAIMFDLFKKKQIWI